MLHKIDISSITGRKRQTGGYEYHRKIAIINPALYHELGLRSSTHESKAIAATSMGNVFLHNTTILLIFNIITERRQRIFEETHWSEPKITISAYSQPIGQWVIKAEGMVQSCA